MLDTYLERKAHERVVQTRSELPAANRPGRVGAFVVDQVVITVCMALMHAFGIDHVSLVVLVLYYVVLHAKFGQTVGKKAFGILVVSADPEAETLTLRQVLIRETIGRFVSTIFFCIGYIAFFFSGDNTAWHDRISNTRVVELDASRADSSFPLLKTLAISIAALTSLFVGFVYVVLFTSYPLNEMAKQLELTGAQVGHINGNLMKGFTLESFAFQDNGSEIQLSDIAFKYDLMKLYTESTLLIDEISVSSGTLKVGTLPALTEGKKEASKSPAQPDKSARPANDTQFHKLKGFRVDRIDIADLAITDKAGKSFQLKRFYVDHLKTDDDGLKVDRVWIDGNALSLDLHHLGLSKQTAKLGETGYLTLKSQLAPKLLKNDVDIQAIVDFSVTSKSVKSLQMGGFRHQLAISKIGKEFVVKTENFNPNQFIQGAPPIVNANLRLQGEFPGILMSPLAGSFGLKSATFTSDAAGNFVYQRPGRDFKLQFTPAVLLTNPASPSFVVESAEHASVEAWLADLYFAKALLLLSPEEQKEVATDASYFRLKPSPVRLPSALAVKGAPMPMPVPVTDKQAILDLLVVCKQGSQAACASAATNIQAACARGDQSFCAILEKMRARAQGR